MIHLFQMRQFMYYDIINDLYGKHGQLPVEFQIFPAVAASSEGVLILQRYISAGKDRESRMFLLYLFHNLYMVKG